MVLQANRQWWLLLVWCCCRVLTAVPVSPATADTHNVVHIDASKVSSLHLRVFASWHFASVVCAVALSCLSISLSVTSQSAIKIAKLVVMQTTLHSGPATPVFWRQRSWWNSNGVTFIRGAKYMWSRLKLVIFEQYLAMSQKWYEIGT